MNLRKKRCCFTFLFVFFIYAQDPRYEQVCDDGETCLTWERNDYVAGAFDISLNAVADKIRESLFATCWRLGPTTLAAS
jgi:hypothetical protein